MSLLVDLMNLLHRHGAHAPDVRAFLRKHKADRAFLRRAKVLMLCFRLRDRLR